MTNTEAIKLFERYYLTQGNSKKTTKDYCWWLGRFLVKPFKEMTAIDIMDFVSIELVSKGRTPSTANQFIAACNAFFKVMNKLDVFKNNIHYSYLKDKAQDARISYRDYLLPEEFMGFVEKNEAYFRKNPGFINCRKWTILHLMAFGALRKSEIMNIKLSDIIFTDRFEVTVSRKGGKRDTVYLPVDFKEPLNLYLTYRRKFANGSEYLFCTSNGKQLYHTAINNDVTWMCKHSGINKNLWPHALRHGASDFMVYNGKSIAVVSSVLGHKNTAITMRRYIRKNEEGKKGVTELFSRIPK